MEETTTSARGRRVRVEAKGLASGTGSSAAPGGEGGAPGPHAERVIRVRGAREHNLKDVDVAIPRDRLAVITGLSGSGKSSLAFDTIFAEGQRKYMESLSAYARQFLEQLKKPDVDEVEGVPPTIAIEQRSAGGNPRSTVATTTEIYDYLRLLFARCGTPHSWAVTKQKKDGTALERSGRAITATSASQIVDALVGSAPARGGAPRLMILAPVVRGKKGFHREVLEDLASQGWTRARVNGAIVDLRDALKEPGENPLRLGRFEKHTIDAVVDRLVLGEGDSGRQRLTESVEAALRLGSGVVTASVEGADGAWADRAYSTLFSDPDHPEVALEELSPRLFSFNSPFGACKACNGLGTVVEFDEDLIVPDPSIPLGEGAIACWNKNGQWRGWFNRSLRRFCKEFGASMAAPVAALSKELRHALLHGAPAAAGAKRGRAWKGVIPETMAWWQSTPTANVKEFLGQFLSQRACATCLGDRLRIEALHVLLTSTHRADASRAFGASVIGRPARDGTMLNIAELARLTINDAIAWVRALVLSAEQRVIAEPILKEVNSRLRFLTGVGLEYLSLDRKTSTLSGGEAQRIRLASQVGSGLVGACYVLDEPTIGLHQRDNARLIGTLRHLADIGNTVLVVEHDEEMIRAADHVLDVGPGAGVHGGRIVAQGTVAEVCACRESITGDYLSGRRAIDVPARRRPMDHKDAIVVRGARQNNLKGIDATFPTRGLICVTGVSGSGKSTLVNEILLEAGRQKLLGSRARPGDHDSIRWPRSLDRIIEVDQTPIGRTPRSNPATYTGFFDEIRRVFVGTKEARMRGYKPGRFSFNVAAQAGGGRCEACQGQGLKKIEMHFLPDVYVECEVCRGRRYNRETLEVLYRGKSIADVLAMTIEAAVEFFENHPRIARVLRCLHDVGLDYVQLGQPSTQLSGGEAQRIKLATELAKGWKSELEGEDGRGRQASERAGERGKSWEGESEEMADDGIMDEVDDPIDAGRSRRKGSAARPSSSPSSSSPGGSRSRSSPSSSSPLLARSLARPSPSSSTLYILDEPTTGLHFEDIRKLVAVLDRLADAGNTLIVIEHNLDVIKRADWIIDLGPEGGEGGGRIVAQGTPEHVARATSSHTGRYLRSILGSAG